MTTTRRDFLRYSGAVTAALPTLGSLTLSLAAMSRANAGAASDYKALVAVFLYGGCDNYNMVLRMDGRLDGAWKAYETARGSPGDDSIALVFDSVPRVFKDSNGNPDDTRPFGWHPELCGPAHDGSTGVQAIFDQGRLAVVTNVGPLMQRTTQQDYNTKSVPLPPKLFSHNDQQSVWQTMADENAQQPGWGGKMADRLPRAPASREQFTCISVHGHAPWLAGNELLPYQVVPSGAVRICTEPGLFDSVGARNELLALIKGDGQAPEDRTHYYERDLVELYKSSIAAETIVFGALEAVGAGPWDSPDNPLTYVDPSYPDPNGPVINPLAAELRMVARMIKASTTSGTGLDGIKRQCFLVGLDGFDTHNDHLLDHASGLAKLSHALAYFDKVLLDMGVRKKVTSFTASDFGRALPSNGNGCDHGWGGHYFVMGGSVDGGKFYGDFPVYGSMGANGYVNSENQVGNGVLLPARSVEQYAATLGAWLGLAPADLDAALPNLHEWDADPSNGHPDERNLGFMKLPT